MVSSVRSVKLTAGEDGHQLGLSHGGQSKPDFRDTSCKVDPSTLKHPPPWGGVAAAGWEGKVTEKPEIPAQSLSYDE